MGGQLQPLDEKFAITDAQGRPTIYFIKWAQQRQIDISDGLTLADLEDYLADHMLLEGSGIQFSPDGNIANGVTISADVQEILDQLSATRGTVLYRGLLGWAALAPGTAGQFLKTNGAGADPAWAAAGGGGGKWWAGHVPLAADFTNSFGTVAPTKTDDTDIGLIIDGGTPVLADAQRIWAKAIPAPTSDWQVTVRADITVGPDGTSGAGLVLLDSVANRALYFGRRNNDYQFGYTRLTLPAGFGANTKTNNLLGIPQWLRMARVGTNNIFSYSNDGKNFTQFISESATAYLTNNGNYIGLGVSYNRTTGNNNYVACDYWVQTW